MLRLPIKVLTYALKASLHHREGILFPASPEINIVEENWQLVGPELAKIDLDTYLGYDVMTSFAPKLRLNVRRVSLLHPYDLIIYTALVLTLKHSISRVRLPSDKVFSYRTEKAGPNQLYSKSSTWKDFRNAVRTKIDEQPERFVGATDIADFYPRIYHHRLVNALSAAAGNSCKDYIRVLEKMLSRFSDGTSYGIPVGPPASRLLGEAVLSDVDDTLVSYGIDFVRFVDDFVIFASTIQDAEYGLRVLAETLFRNHGLTLATAKTKVSAAAQYAEQTLTSHNEKEVNRRELLQLLGDDPYEMNSYEDLDEDQKKGVDAFNLTEMLEEALGEGEKVDYQEVQFILGRLASLRKPELIPTVLNNLERLYPVAESVAAFFKEFGRSLERESGNIGDALLKPLLNPISAKPSEYYAIWILSIFEHHRSWNHAEELLRIFQETSSDVMRRSAALALGKSGTRSQAISLKQYLQTASSLCRTAILLATAKMGRDEREYYTRSQRLSDSLEQLCAKSKL